MWISEIELKCIKSFHEAHLNLSKEINIIIGSNNCGKSTILQSVLNLQKFQYSATSVRIKADTGISCLQVREINKNFKQYMQIDESDYGFVETTIGRQGSLGVSFHNSGRVNISNIGAGSTVSPETEPDNLIYPYLSKRKVTQFRELMNKAEANAVTGELS
jgi:AAA15 family ATPase/GTPase